jgi:outer membrane protein TolC
MSGLSDLVMPLRQTNQIRPLMGLVRNLRNLIPLAVVLAFLGCALSPPKVHDVPATSPAPTVAWVPPVSIVQKPAKTGLAIPIEQIQDKLSKFTLADAVAIALQNNPATRVAWADARAAAARYGSAHGAWYPKVDLNGTLYYEKDITTKDQPGASTKDISATASLSYLLFDFGGRSAVVEESRQSLLAADWTQNAVIQNTVLQAEMAYFNQAGAKALLEANRTSLAEAEANLTAAEERHRMGLATNADVLQAKTAYAEVKLAVLDTAGQVRTAKGALAVAMGYPANITFDPEMEVPEIPRGGLAQTVDQLIEKALASRPDLQAAQAQALGAAAKVQEARSRMLPSFSATGSIGRLWLKDVPGYTNSTIGALQLQIPIFSGFSRDFDLLQAKAEAEAARERLRSAEQTVIFQVFSMHSEFLTADERVKTTDELVASASQSEAVALGRYREGVGSILDLLSAQRVLAVARAEQINARLGWFINLARLAHDIGILGLPGDNSLAAAALLSR